MVLRPLVVAAVAAGGLLMGATAAYAVETIPAADLDVEFVDDNVSDCNTGEHPAGLDGSILAEGVAVEGTIYGPDGNTIDVTIKAGYTATGIVVKGGPGAHIYTPSEASGPLEGEIKVTGLISPPVGEGQDITPGISHWFVCGYTTPPTTPPATTEPPVTTEPPTTTKEPELPVTGAGLTAVVIAGLALVGGGTALLIMRRRRDALENPAEL